MTSVRDHLVFFWLAMVAGILGLGFAGFWAWDRWLQLVAMGALMVVCTRLLAPVYFGWREPGEVRGRPRRR